MPDDLTAKLAALKALCEQRGAAYDEYAARHEPKPPLPDYYSHLQHSPRNWWVLGRKMGGGMDWFPNVEQIDEHVYRTLLPALIEFAQAMFSFPCYDFDMYATEIRAARAKLATALEGGQ